MPDGSRDEWNFSLSTPVVWALALAFHVYDSAVAVLDRYKLKRQRRGQK